MRLFDMSHRVVIVTGSTRGIGKGIAAAMFEAGANVVVSGRHIEQCEEAAQELCSDESRVLPIACNISDDDQLTKLVASTLAKWGRIDSLICNAAVNPYYGNFLDTPDDAFEKTIRVNIRSNMQLSKLVVPSMMEQREGTIIVISSIAAFKGSEKLGLYGLTKAADIQLIRNIAVAYGPHNIRANAIAPAVVRTEFSKVLWEDPKRSEAVRKSYALKRLGEVDDIAGAAVYLASPAGAWMTGQTMIIDGGWSVYGEIVIDRE